LSKDSAETDTFKKENTLPQIHHNHNQSSGAVLFLNSQKWQVFFPRKQIYSSHPQTKFHKN
jgi:hypothetical protein